MHACRCMHAETFAVVGDGATDDGQTLNGSNFVNPLLVFAAGMARAWYLFYIRVSAKQ